ncbi:ROK family protein [Candidatus Methylacidithermus pantelleriae]|uniref:Fructokinase n=1 Tax=Candidatus Methylacidithermus pantelleriae TaxID=2744239 RepID=A0A8J2FWQ6_9BACT|nr:ROK family protein [Candidatus Methylacidithermus pantelleriae]CAF0700706.1 Fructokinase [Candidatus Methylacidithermus pantelleriae]
MDGPSFHSRTTLRIGIDLGGSKSEIALLTPDGRTLCRYRRPTPRGSYEAILQSVVSLVQEVEDRWKVRGIPIGIGTPGSISPETGLLQNSNITELNGKPLRKDLQELLGPRVRIENDANCFTLSEARDGAACHARVVFGVILGTGTGGGIVVEGKLLPGVNRVAGEWGHNPLPWPTPEEFPGPPCYCGKRGCIETFLSGPGLSLDFRTKTGLELSAQIIAERSRQGDMQCREAILLYIDRLARSLACVINILDPDVIVLGGGLSQIPAIYTEIGKFLPRYVFFSHTPRTRIVRNLHGDSSGVRGAAWLWDLES